MISMLKSTHGTERDIKVKIVPDINRIARLTIVWNASPDMLSEVSRQST